MAVSAATRVRQPHRRTPDETKHLRNERKSGYQRITLSASTSTGAGRYLAVTLLIAPSTGVGLVWRAKHDPDCGDDATHSCAVVRFVVRNTALRSNDATWGEQ